MPVLTVSLPDGEREITFSPGRSVRDVLDETDIRVRAGCNGTGACGLCQIRISGGDAGEPSENEITLLGAELLSGGVRLACQVSARSGLHIEILKPAPPSVWLCLDETGSACTAGGTGLHHLNAAGPLGAAVDLGTTHISISLLDLVSGCRVTGRRGLNPQAASGADVLTRLTSASSRGQAEKLSRQVVDAIGEGLRDISAREGIDLRRVNRVVLAGNTTMLALLSGRNFELLLEPRYWTEKIDCLPPETVSWRTAWEISPEAVINVIPPLAGFVGSDLLSGVVATNLMEQGPGALLMDFGTNSEIALWDGKKLWVTSAAGGPAFEGNGLSCGMPADPGAIYRVVMSDATEELAFDVIAGAEPRGLCGTGLVDLLSCLVRRGTLNSRGQFAKSVAESGFPLYRGIALAKKDVDLFQRAKAAIGVAVCVLCAKAGIGYGELRRICIGGVFGRHLNTANAQKIGLLPAIPGQFIETAGNTSLSGCEIFLLSSDAEDRFTKARNAASLVNLSGCGNFGEIFLENLYLRPFIENRDHDRIAF